MAIPEQQVGCTAIPLTCRVRGRCTWGKSPSRTSSSTRNVRRVLTRVLDAVWEATGKSVDTIKKLRYDVYDGSYNLRNIRGSAASLSMHAFAAAIDWDAADNEQHAQRHLFQNDSLLVVKFKEAGWIWGGDGRLLRSTRCACRPHAFTPELKRSSR